MNAIDPGTQEARPAQNARAPYAMAPMSTLRDPRTKSPVLAGVLSLMPGLGQVYVGYYPKGFVHATVVAGILSILSAADEAAPYLPLLGMFLAFFWLYNIIDAARLAALYNQALAGGQEPDLPEGFKLPGMGGSIVGGAALLAAGFILLLHTRWGVSLEWVEAWWPVFPMLFGAYLLGKAILDRRGSSSRG
jgi:hypothetical protein